MTQSSHAKFDCFRADEYGHQARIALAGYDACHELSACILSASLRSMGEARVLVVGAGGTGGEIIAAARLEPMWKFFAIDPSEPMLALAEGHIGAAGLQERVAFIRGELADLPNRPEFDAAIMIGVLHHIPTEAGKADILARLSERLRPGAPLVLAGNYRPYASEPLLLAAWGNRWRMHGAGPDEIEAKLAKIMNGAVPPETEEKVETLLSDAGFDKPRRFFASLFWGAWHTRKRPIC
ncbi:class I SAM-dependent methyltransferase [Methylovirgula sp. 4M-Z18]|uniref:class I SAM-dependent methyltransferase n=1 Tax=Methylovirgula sp. 4M-Z18 TaxID=2293567 RepID=UPI000E2F9896|nr:class I SAM-dependent methyltransferase [Methylovirgula sp. 4M-Z18]RFB78479.1 class I SAM-dependent methyltransferase [Methylovirgula sp. 4M-Z18]